jgi:hypothetical protein
MTVATRCATGPRPNGAQIPSRSGGDGYAAPPARFGCI